jgi:hypothetical protein
MDGWRWNNNGESKGENWSRTGTYRPGQLTAGHNGNRATTNEVSSATMRSMTIREQVLWNRPDSCTNIY